MKCISFIVIGLICSVFAVGQDSTVLNKPNWTKGNDLSQKFIISAYALIGPQFKTKFNHSSGNVKPAEKDNKRGLVLEGGMNIRMPINKKLSVITGAEGQLLFTAWEFNASVSPNDVPDFQIVGRIIGDDYILRENYGIRLGIPILLQWMIKDNVKKSIYINGGPAASFYIGESVGWKSWLHNKWGVSQTIEEVYRIKPKEGIQIRPELNANAGIQFKNKNYGSIGFGLKVHYGYNFIKYGYSLYPGIKDYESYGTFRPNRSYAGFFVNYEFVRHNKKSPPVKNSIIKNTK